MSEEWWGYDTQKQSWVFLDRTFKNNKPEFKHLPLIFVDCHEGVTYEIARKDWEKPRFLYEAEAIKLLDEVEMKKINTLKINKEKYQKIINKLDAKKVEHENEIVGGSISVKKYTPEEIRKMYCNGMQDDEWLEIISYVSLMKKNNIKDQGVMNEYISRNRLWNNFPIIRSMNDHGYGIEIAGITPKAYKIVCKLIDMHTGLGNPLLGSRKY